MILKSYLAENDYIFFKKRKFELETFFTVIFLKPSGITICFFNGTSIIPMLFSFIDLFFFKSPRTFSISTSL